MAVKVLIRDRSKMIAYAWSIVHDIHLAEDIFQEMMVRAIDQHQNIRDMGALPFWARQVIRNLAIDTLRKHQRESMTLAPDVLEQLDPHWNDTQPYEKEQERITALHFCFEKLPPKARHVINKKFREGKTGTTIAEELECKTASVYMALSRAYQALAECIRRKMQEQEEVSRD